MEFSSFASNALPSGFSSRSSDLLRREDNERLYPSSSPFRSLGVSTTPLPDSSQPEGTLSSVDMSRSRGVPVVGGGEPPLLRDLVLDDLESMDLSSSTAAPLSMSSLPPRSLPFLDHGSKRGGGDASWMSSTGRESTRGETGPLTQSVSWRAPNGGMNGGGGGGGGGGSIYGIGSVDQRWKSPAAPPRDPVRIDDPIQWTADDVVRFLLETCELSEEYGDVFRTNDINGKLALTISDEDLQFPPFEYKTFARSRPLQLALRRMQRMHERAQESLHNVYKLPDLCLSILRKQLEVAIVNRDLPKLQFLLLQAPQELKDTLLLFTVCQSQELIHSEPIRILLGGGSDPNVVSPGGVPVLFFALERGDIYCAKLLMDAGADLSWQADEYCIEHVEDPTTKESVVRAQTLIGDSILVACVRSMSPRFLQLLLSKYAWTPDHIARSVVEIFRFNPHLGIREDGECGLMLECIITHCPPSGRGWQNTIIACPKRELGYKKSDVPVVKKLPPLLAILDILQDQLDLYSDVRIPCGYIEELVKCGCSLTPAQFNEWAHRVRSFHVNSHRLDLVNTMRSFGYEIAGYF